MTYEEKWAILEEFEPGRVGKELFDLGFSMRIYGIKILDSSRFTLLMSDEMFELPDVQQAIDNVWERFYVKAKLETIELPENMLEAL